MKDSVRTKHAGQVFTPRHLVETMLDFCGYSGADILGKQVMDNSCGDGAFLCEVVRRYMAAAKEAGLSQQTLRRQLETCIHGMDRDAVACELCKRNLDALVGEMTGMEKAVKWDVGNKDSLSVHAFDGQMDYVVGNPPYVRVHNLDAAYRIVKQFAFAQGGMTDLFLAFYELGFRMLSPTGTLCYITPSSWLSSVAGSRLRDYVRSHRTLRGVIDLGHYQAFSATTYTLIALFQNGVDADGFDWYTYDAPSQHEVFQERLSFAQADIGGVFCLARTGTLETLRRVREVAHPRRAVVKNGFATLADKVFIGDVPEKTSITIPVIKASTGKWQRCLFPYDRQGRPVPEGKLFSEKPVKAYFEAHKQDLLKGRPENQPEWYCFGRTQALKDVFTHKYAINCIVRDKGSVKLNAVPAGSGVYSGLYILTTVDESVLRDIVTSPEFVEYVSSLKRYKSGGYFSFSSKDLELYLNYRLDQLHAQAAPPRLLHG